MRDLQRKSQKLLRARRRQGGSFREVSGLWLAGAYEPDGQTRQTRPAANDGAPRNRKPRLSQDRTD